MESDWLVFLMIDLCVCMHTCNAVIMISLNGILNVIVVCYGYDTHVKINKLHSLLGRK